MEVEKGGDFETGCLKRCIALGLLVLFEEWTEAICAGSKIIWNCSTLDKGLELLSSNVGKIASIII